MGSKRLRPEIEPRARVKISDIIDCPPDLSRIRVGEVCGARLDHLRPTQATVGYIQVYTQARKLASLNKSKLEVALLEKPIPVVIGPDRQAYVIDHHHHAATLWVLGFKRCIVEVKERCLSLTEGGFWRKMRRNKWIHLYDEHGQELDDRTRLPLTISRLRDNIYQSVAWATRKEGGFTKSAVAVSDFKWPDFFRDRLAPVTERNFKSSVRKAVKLARSPGSEGLPGRIRG